jgi:hypothetical protein
MEANQLGQAILAGEYKTLQSIAKRLPRQDGSGIIGVNSGTAWTWIDRGQLKLEQVLIDGERFYHVPAADQLLADWNLQSKFEGKRAKRGRVSAKELLGFTPRA